MWNVFMYKKIVRARQKNPCILVESVKSRQIRIRMQRESSLLMIIFRPLSGTQFKSKLNFL